MGRRETTNGREEAFAGNTGIDRCHNMDGRQRYSELGEVAIVLPVKCGRTYASSEGGEDAIQTIDWLFRRDHGRFIPRSRAFSMVRRA